MNLKRILIGVAALAGLCVVLVILPSFVDWNDHKDVIAGRMEAMLGRPVTLNGPLSFALLPTPRLEAADVSVAPGGEGVTLDRVDALEMRLKPLALLRGRFEPASLVLVGPRLSLGPFSSPRDKPSPSSIPEGAADQGAVPLPLLAERGEKERLPQLSVRNGTILIRRTEAEPFRIDAVDADYSAEAMAQRLSGTVRVEGIDLAFDATLGRSAKGDPLPLSLSLSRSGRGGQVKADGLLSGEGFKGRLSLKLADLSDFARALRVEAPLPKVPLSLEAKLAATPGQITAEDLSLLLADQSAKGRISLDLSSQPRAEIKLAFGRLDADALIAALPKAEKAMERQAPSSPSSPPSSPDQPATVRPTSAKISAMVDLAADFVIYRGGTIRNARLAAQTEGGEIVIDQASAALPGNAEVNLFGFVPLGGEPAFEGSFEGVADDLRGLLSWLGVDLKDVPADRLRALRLAGNLKARPEMISLEDVQMRLDGNKVQASLDFRPGPRPSLGLTFALDVLNLDAYVPALAAPVAGANGGGQSTSPAQASAPAGASPWFSAVDASVKGRIGQVLGRGVTAKAVAVDAGWNGARLTLNDLSIGGVEGAVVKLAGGIDLRPLSFHALQIDVKTEHPEHLANVLGLSLPVDPARFGPVALTGRLDGAPDQVAVDGRAEASGLVVTAAGKAAGWPGPLALDAAVTANHANLTQALRLVLPDYRPRGPLGPFSASLHLAGGKDTFSLSDLQLKLGPVNATGTARIQGGNHVDLVLSADQVPIDPFLQAKGAAARPIQRNAAPAISPAPAKVSSKPASGSSAGGPPPPQAAPRPKVESTDIPALWSDAPLGLDALKAFEGTAKIDAKSLSYAGMRLDAATLGITLSQGVVTLDRLNGRFYDGTLTASGRLDSDGALSVKANLVHASLQQALVGIAGLDFAQGTAEASLDMATSGRSTLEMIGRLNGEARVAVSDGVIKGFDLKAMDQAASAGPTGLIALAETALSGGSTHFSSLSGRFHAANGIISTQDLALTAEGGGATATGAVNLPLSVMDTRAEFRLAAGGNTPPLVMRMTGPLDHPRRFIDINAIQSWLGRRMGAPEDHPSAGQKAKPKDLLKSLLQKAR